MNIFHCFIFFIFSLFLHSGASAFCCSGMEVEEIYIINTKMVTYYPDTGDFEGEIFDFAEDVQENLLTTLHEALAAQGEETNSILLKRLEGVKHMNQDIVDIFSLITLDPRLIDIKTWYKKDAVIEEPIKLPVPAKNFDKLIKQFKVDINKAEELKNRIPLLMETLAGLAVGYYEDKKEESSQDKIIVEGKKNFIQILVFCSQLTDEITAFQKTFKRIYRL